jgi:hypothetical protein
MTEPGTCAPQIMRGQFRETGTSREFMYYRPYDLLSYAGSPNGSGLANTSKQPPAFNFRNVRPLVDAGFYPGWDWHRSDVTSLANQIDNRPPFLSLLDVFDCQMSNLRSP